MSRASLLDKRWLASHRFAPSILMRWRESPTPVSLATAGPGLFRSDTGHVERGLREGGSEHPSLLRTALGAVLHACRSPCLAGVLSFAYQGKKCSAFWVVMTNQPSYGTISTVAGAFGARSHRGCRRRSPTVLDALESRASKTESRASTSGEGVGGTAVGGLHDGRVSCIEICSAASPCPRSGRSLATVGG